MIPPDLERLLRQRKIETVPVDAAFAVAHLDRARITLAQTALLTDPGIQERLHYEAALHAALGLLAHHGYRLRSGPGHHEAAIDFLRAHLAGDATADAALGDLDMLRRTRNNELYRARQVGAQSAAASRQAASAVVEAVARHLTQD